MGNDDFKLVYHQQQLLINQYLVDMLDTHSDMHKQIVFLPINTSHVVKLNDTDYKTFRKLPPFMNSGQCYHITAIQFYLGKIDLDQIMCYGVCVDEVTRKPIGRIDKFLSVLRRDNPVTPFALCDVLHAIYG